MNRFFILLLVLAGPLLARAQGPDEQYVRIYQMIQEADRLGEAGQMRAAAAKYVEAQEALTRFRGIYPGWNERVINYRLNYVATKLAPLATSLTGTPALTTTPASATNVSATNIFSSVVPPTNVLTVAPPPATAPPMAAELENQFKAMQAEIQRLQAENQKLSARVKEAFSVQPAGIDPREMAKAEERIRSLMKENDLIKAELAKKSAAPSPDLTAKVAEQNEVISALRTENDVLKKQTAEWREKHDAVLAIARRSPMEAQAAVDKLAADNIALQKQAALWKQMAQSNQPPTQTNAGGNASMPLDAQRELALMRARLKVLEAAPVPYTAEELALFQKSSPALVNAEAVAAKAAPAKSDGVLPAEGPLPNVARGVPPGAATLVRAAERAFAMGQYAEAEQKYSDVLRQQPENVTMLANLASAQLENGRAAEAETNVLHALRLDPEDHFSLYLLGRLRFRQEKLDEALDALSRSAKANPDYADTQNYLGIVLSEKGLRGPAEAALRKAIQLQPDNPVAHHNLSVVYATQKPPALALARWHYKKAREAGHPKDADLEKLLQ